MTDGPAGAAIRKMIDDTFEPDQRGEAQIYMANLARISTEAGKPHIVLPILIAFLRITQDLTPCDDCRAIIDANLKDVN